MNDLAVQALGLEGLRDVVPAADLSPGLRTLLAEGLALRGEALVFAGCREPVPHTDLTGWECSVNRFHLEDVVPVQVDISAGGQPTVSDADQAVLLRHGAGFAVEIVRLAREQVVPVRCIVSANATNGTFRFHRVRPGERWVADDLDSYPADKLIVVDG